MRLEESHAGFRHTSERFGPLAPGGRFVTGDAERAAAAILSWLDERAPVSEEAVEFKLLELRRAARRLAEEPLVRNDGEAQAMLDAMAAAPDMEALTAALGRLEERVGVLLKRRQGAARSVARPSATRTLLRL
jgi:hypothetical protein